MADNPGEPNLLAALAKLAPLTPGIAGAVLSMAFGERLTVRGKALSVCIGLACALWLAPAVIALLGAIWPWGKIPVEVGQAVTFLTGLFGMIVLAGLVPWLTKVAGDPLALLKVRISTGEG